MKIYGKNGIIEITPHLRTDPDLDVMMLTISDNNNPDILLSIGFTPYDGIERWMKLGSNPGDNPEGTPDIEYNRPGCPEKVETVYFTTDQKAADAIWEWLEAQGVYNKQEMDNDQTT